MPVKKTAIKRLLGFIFWIFLIVTIGQIIYLVVIPTPEEWPGRFPDEIPDSWWNPFLRHLSLFSSHLNISNLINLINNVFLTIFVYKIGLDVKEGLDKRDGRIRTSAYVEWTMGSLFSGIIFAAARIGSMDVFKAALYVVLVGVFSAISYYFLDELRRKLRKEEDRAKVK